MKKSGAGKRLFLFILEAAIILNIQGIPVWAENVPLDGASEIVTEQPDKESKADGRTGEHLNATDDLSDYQIRGLNPEQAIVNLFDYWQDIDDHTSEVTHDYWINDDDPDQGAVTTYNKGISIGHLLRFGYRDQQHCQYCRDHGYGEWNEYCSTGPFPEIVQNKLDGGYPKLNFGGKEDAFFGSYQGIDDDGDGIPDYVNEDKKTESLAYLFSPEDASYKKCYPNVQGLFQIDGEGYYYYDSTQNFAELGDDGSFILYKSPGVGKEPDTDTGSTGNYGQFFPFNHADMVFDTKYTDGKSPLLGYTGWKNTDVNDENYENMVPIQDREGTGYIQCYAPGLNHYLGMTLEVPFLQPEQGVLPGTTKPMSFAFSGDDDVWIFIDDVLVADLGGLHDACSLKIDFATGNVYVKDILCGNLLQSFQKAFNTSASNPGGIAFAGNTFADNTVHTLKMFYLERGNMASNLYLRFNLQIARYNQIKKVDQNGNPIKNVVFELYPAQTCSQSDPESILCTNIAGGGTYYVKKQNVNGPLLTLTTDENGIADFTDYSFSRSTTQYYILHETSPPVGYRPQPVDIVLEYNSGTEMLSVANRWETGSYASFTSYVNERAGEALHYAQYKNGVIDETSRLVPREALKNGLVLAVPMLERGTNDWIPLYGSNINGFHTTATSGVGNTAGSMEMALLEAALNQCLYDEGWYLSWSDETEGLVGCLSDLPGRADRYRHVDPGGDMQMAYIIIEKEALERIGITGGSSEDKYRKLKQYVVEKNKVNETPDTIVSTIYGAPGAGNVNMLDTKEFMRVFRSLIYISNEQRELRVLKVDKNGQPLDGAVFGIYKTEEGARQNLTADLITSGETANGILIFKPQVPNGQKGYAQITWAALSGQTYYLKEIKAPAEYEVNDTVIPVKIGTYSIYADAGAANDGVWVRASVGHLYQTMTKYATDGDVNITLRDINAIAQKQDSTNFQVDGWQDTEVGGEKQIALHYGMSTEAGMDYGLHDVDANKGMTPFFETDTGFLRVRVTQNGNALQGSKYDTPTNARWDSLGNTDLTGLFSLLNVVVVEDRSLSTEQRELRVLKVDEDNVPLNGVQFGLYSSREAAENNDETKAVASGITATVNGQAGVLIFQAQPASQPGFAQVSWTAGNYYLKEISAPAGYQINETIIPIVVEEASVYADAGTEDDGVLVRAGVGCLNWEKAEEYVKNSDTLRDILAYAQSQDMEDFSASAWKDLDENDVKYVPKALHYGMNAEMGMDYGLHEQDVDLGLTPFFETDTGFIRTRVMQNIEELQNKTYDNSVGQWSILTEDPTPWFSQLNIVVVKNQKTQNPADDPDGPVPETGIKTYPGTDPDMNSSTGMDTDKGGFPISFDVLLERIGKIPQTGDDSLIWWWALLCIVSLLGIGATVCNLIFVRRKQMTVLPERKQKQHLSERKQKQHLSKRRQQKRSSKK